MNKLSGLDILANIASNKLKRKRVTFDLPEDEQILSENQNVKKCYKKNNSTDNFFFSSREMSILENKRNEIKNKYPETLSKIQSINFDLENIKESISPEEFNIYIEAVKDIQKKDPELFNKLRLIKKIEKKNVNQV
jgi:hypothetical protein